MKADLWVKSGLWGAEAKADLWGGATQKMEEMTHEHAENIQ